MLSLNPEDDPYLAALRQAVETRSIEFKESCSFELIRWKLVKACMAMANLRDGGHIIVGCDERLGVPRPTGMSDIDRASYNQDVLMALVNRYAKPYVSLTLRHIEFDSMKFVGITISPFEMTPVLCVKDNAHEKPHDKQRLREAEIYARSFALPSTTRVVDPELLADMLSIAAEKRAAQIISTAQRVGLTMPNSSKAKFELERQDFGEL